MAQPNAEPVVSQVLQNVIVTLQGINIANGCWFDIKPQSVSLEPQEVMLVADTECPFLLVVMQPEGRIEYEPAHQMWEVLVAAIIGRVDVTNPDEPGAKMKAGNRLVADLERRLTIDISRGGHCVDTRLRKPRIIYGLGNDPIVLVEQLIDMRRHRTNGVPES